MGVPGNVLFFFDAYVSSLGEGEESGTSAGAFSFLLLLVATVIWVGHLLKNSRLTFITQGSLALVTGLAAGGCLFYYFELVKKTHIPSTLVAFKYEIYMDLLLPPIIFYAGFGIKKKAFFYNFGAVTTLGVVGTVLTATLLALGASLALSLIGLDKQTVASSLALGTIFSSTDSVAALQAIEQATHPRLHALVFGESVVNDATAIVLLRAVQRIRTEAQLNAETLAAIMVNFIRLSFLSLMLGAGVGLACAWILKRSFSGRHSTDREVSLLAVLGFLSYLTAEYFGLSGVFATFFCGLTMSHYAWHTLSPSAKVVSVYTFRILSFLAELVLFLACGLDLWSTSLWQKEVYTKGKMIRQTWVLALWLTAVVPIARAVVIAPLISVINASRTPETAVSRADAVALVLAGCGRGAVTLALAVNHFIGGKGAEEEASVQNQIIGAACMVAVVLSTIVLGGVTPSLLEKFIGGKEISRHRSWLFESYAALPQAAPGTSEGASTRGDGNGNGFGNNGVRGYMMKAGVGGMREAWTKIDHKFLQPVFGGRSLSLYRSPPPSPGRWRGAASAFSVLEQHRTQVARQEGSQARPTTLPGLVASPFSSIPDIQETKVEDSVQVSQNLPPGSPNTGGGDLGRTVLDELFSYPGEAGFSEDLVDDRLELEGMVAKAENMEPDT